MISEFEKRINAFDREYIKRELWALGMLRTVDLARKEFPSWTKSFIKSADAKNRLNYYEPHTIEILNWFEKWFGSEEGEK